MSVPTYQRKTGKLEAIVKAKAFYIHIARSLMNEKKFDPAYWDIITKEIIYKAQKMYLDCWRANNVRVRTKNEYLARRGLQEDAKLEALDIYGLLSPAIDIFHIPMRRVCFWADGLEEIIKLISAWEKSDYDRYAKLEKDAG